MTDSTPDSGRITVGVDGSAHSVHALRWALRQAVLTGWQVDAVACWHVSSIVGTYVPEAYFDIDLNQPTADLARAAVAEAVAATPGAADVTVNVRVLKGYPTTVLLQTADGADLLVVGSRGHSELSGVLLGSVGLHCATHAKCPVVVVHDPVG